MLDSILFHDIPAQAAAAASLTQLVVLCVCGGVLVSVSGEREGGGRKVARRAERTA